MLRTSKGSTSIGRLITDRVAHWIYTNGDDDQKEIMRVSESYKVSENIAAMAIGYAESNRTSVDEEIYKLSNPNAVTSLTKDILNQLNNV